MMPCDMEAFACSPSVCTFVCSLPKFNLLNEREKEKEDGF